MCDWFATRVSPDARHLPENGGIPFGNHGSMILVKNGVRSRKTGTSREFLIWP